jgi:hypothetical protein
MRPVTVKPDAGPISLRLYPRAAERGVLRREGLSIAMGSLPCARRAFIAARHVFAHCVPRGARAQVVLHRF